MSIYTNNNQGGNSITRYFDFIKNITLICIVCFILMCFVLYAFVYDNTKIVFFDDFNNLHNWNIENTLGGDGNGCYEYYTSSNVVIDDSVLNIFPSLNTHTSIDQMTGN
jgi:hypothetical protein